MVALVSQGNRSDLHVLAAEAGELTFHHQGERRVGDALLGKDGVPVVGDPGPAQQARAQLVGQPMPGRVVAERDDPLGAVGVEERVDVGLTPL